MNQISRRRALVALGTGAAAALAMAACGPARVIPGLSRDSESSPPPGPGARDWAGRLDALRKLAPGAVLLDRPLDAQIRPDRRGPWANRLLLAFSGDGLTWERTNVILSNYCDVPVMIEHAGEVHCYFVSFTEGARNRIVRATTPDLVNWSMSVVEIAGVARPWSDPVDPTVVVTADGRYRLYFTAAATTAGRPATYSATSRDGLAFELEPGVRFTAASDVLDPSVLRTGESWAYFAGGGGSIGKPNFAAVSTDGLTFTEVEPPAAPGLILANGTAANGGYRYYAFEQGRPGDVPAIRSLFSPDGRAWRVEDGRRLTPNDSAFESGGVKDPAVARLGDSLYLMAYVSGIPQYANVPREGQSGPPPPR